MLIGLAICMFATSISWRIMSIPEFFIKIELGDGMASWILSAYIIAEVALLPVAGKLIDIHGPRGILGIGAVLFVAACIACSICTTVDQMIVLRAFQGAGAGLVFAVVLSAVGLYYPRSRRSKAHELMTAAFAFGSIYGTMVGYWLSLNMSWDYAFYLCAALMVIGAVVAYIRLPDGTGGGMHDLFGTVLSVLLIGDLMVFSQIVNRGFEFISTESAIMLAVAVVSAILLIAVERRVRDPLLPRYINRSQIGYILCMFLAGFCGLGMVQFLMKFMLFGLGVDIYTASTVFLALLLGGGATSMIGLKKMNVTGVRIWALVGPVIIIIGFLVASQAMVHGLPFIAVSLFIIGMGFGCIVTEILCAVQATTRRKNMGSMTSVTMASRFVGILLGIASYTAIVDNRLMSEANRIIEELGIHEDPSYIIDNWDLYFDDVVQVFESSIEFCSILAAILSVSILIAAYRLIGNEDVDAPEFVDEEC